MCGASEGGVDGENVQPKLDEDYILEPFPNDQFIPDAWQDVLATVDVCVNEVTPTVFCDEEGYDIVPVHMVRVLHDETKQEKEKQDNTETRDLKLLEEISICDQDPVNESSNEEEDHHEQIYYDASDELEDFEELEPIVVQLRDGKEIIIPREPSELQKRRRRERQTRTKGQRYAPEFRGKQHFLRSSQAKDCVKDKITGCYLIQEEKTTPKTETKTKRNKTKQEDKSVKNQIEKPKLTKTERRAKYNELKRELKQVWST